MRSLVPWILLILAWALTLPASAGLADGPPRWLSAHTLLCFQGYDHWGVLPTLGANLILPPTAETAGADIRMLAKGEGAYLTYPSLWTLALYLPYRLLGVASPEGWLQAAGLVLVRLVGALAAFVALREVARLALPADRPAWQAEAPALAGAIAWLTAPTVLYYSQYELFADQFVLPAGMVATAIVLRARFDLAALPPAARAGLAAAGLLAWGTEWLGWLQMAAITAACAWVAWPTLPGGSPEAKVGAFARRAGVLLLPAAVALGWYAIQLTWYAEGWAQLLDGFRRRALSNQADEGQALDAATVAARIARHVGHGVPGVVHEGALRLLDAGATGARPAPSALVAALAAFAAVWGPLAAWRRAAEPRLFRLAVGVLALPPIAHTLLLPQHAALHPFSGTKMVLPLALALLTLPLIGVLQRVPARRTPLVAGATAVLTAGLLAGARPALMAMAPPPVILLPQLAALAAAELRPGDMVVSDQIAFDTMKPHALHAAGRLFHHPDALVALAPKLAPAALDAAVPVAVAYADEAAASRLAPLAAGRWHVAAQRLGGREVVVARLPEQRGRLVAWLRSHPAAPP